MNNTFGNQVGNNQLVFFVEGNIGSSKSTVLDTLKMYNNVQIIPEPVDKWIQIKQSKGLVTKNILELFYEDPKQYAFQFQMMCLYSRMAQIDSIEKTKQYVFIERSIYTDSYCFAKLAYKSGLLSHTEWCIYKNTFKWVEQILLEKLKYNFHILYLKASPEVCLDRIKKRNRSGEQNIETSYLFELGELHDQWLSGVKNLLVVDTQVLQYHENNQHQQTLHNLIEEYIKKSQSAIVW